MPKKKWTTPQLIVLVRGKPGEGILGACKAGAFTGDPIANLSSCTNYLVFPGALPCLTCERLDPS